MTDGAATGCWKEAVNGTRFCRRHDDAFVPPQPLTRARLAEIDALIAWLNDDASHHIEDKFEIYRALIDLRCANLALMQEPE